MIKKISNKYDLYLIYSNFQYTIYNGYDGIIAKSNKINFNNNDVSEINIIIDIDDYYNISNIKKCITTNVLEYEKMCTDKTINIEYNVLAADQKLNNKYYLKIDIKEYFY